MSKARPLCIDYRGAWYHVTNRGAGRRQTFPDDRLSGEFLRLLGDINEMYDVQGHAYCLMGDHYHLLAQTERANLGRAMRHLDGVYTQRHNRQLKTDGPLFRGRDRALVIERDSYLLRASRYIHRNPLAAGKKLPPVLGTDSFFGACRHQIKSDSDYEIPQAKALSVSITLDDIIDVVCAHFAIARQDLIAVSDQRTPAARAMTMLLCRQCGGFKLRDNADAFGIARYTSVASGISRLGEKAKQDAALEGEIDRLREQVQEMRNA